jgi:uncharacterized membrane protein YdjX (TVP38/TMEM64 family)
VKPLKVILGTLWIGLLVGLILLWWRSHVPLSDIPALLEQELRDFGLYRAAAIYVFIYAIRPVTLFPATLLTVASGLIFGPWLGTLFTIIGENASANIAFLIGRWFGRNTVEKHSGGIFQRWDEKLKNNALVAVMTMRLIMLPFDAVNFACGLTGMRQRDYAIGTAIGILPSLIGFVLLGGVAAVGVNNRLLILGMSIFFMLLGLGLASYLRKKERPLIEG